MKSTQRVEKTNHLVKKLNNNNSRASITSIVNTTLEKAERDYFQGIFNTHRDALKGSSRRQSTVEASSATSGIFKELLQAHEGLLDFFARDRMTEEMNYSLGYRCDSTSLSSLHEENSVRQNSLAQFMEQVEQHEDASYYHITSKMTFQPGTTL
ncbi:hypothetical protein BG003_001140, partial [Podila horticola]